MDKIRYVTNIKNYEKKVASSIDAYYICTEIERKMSDVDFWNWSNDVGCILERVEVFKKDFMWNCWIKSKHKNSRAIASNLAGAKIPLTPPPHRKDKYFVHT